MSAILILFFISLLSKKYRVSHKQSPDIVREQWTCKLYTYFLTVVRAMSMLVDFQKWFQSVSSTFRYQVDPFFLGHILKHLVLFWCYDNDIGCHDCHGNKRIWPDVLHTSKLPLRDEAFKPLKYKMAGWLITPPLTKNVFLDFFNLKNCTLENNLFHSITLHLCLRNFLENCDHKRLLWLRDMTS